MVKRQNTEEVIQSKGGRIKEVSCPDLTPQRRAIIRQQLERARCGVGNLRCLRATPNMLPMLS